MMAGMTWAAGRRAGLALGVSLAAACGATTGAIARNSGQPPPLFEAGGWTGFCDNQGGCGLANTSTWREARANARGPARAWMCVWLGPTGDTDAIVSVKLDEALEDRVARPAIVVESDDGRRATLRAAGDGRHELLGPDAVALALSLGASAEIALREPEGGPVLDRLSLDGYPRAMRAIEAKRTDARPPREIVPRGFARVERAVPRGLAALHREWCDATPWEPRSARAYRLFDGTHLWTASCARSAYNPVTLVGIEAGDGSVGALQLPSVVDHDMVGPGFTNLALDPARGRLDDLFKRRGANDCGTRRAWVWNGGRFALVSEHTMGHCHGASHDQWQRMSVTPVRGEPPPGRRPC